MEIYPLFFLTGKETLSERCRIPAASPSPAEYSLGPGGVDKEVTKDAVPI